MCVMSKLRRFRGKEEGSATIEFVLLFPALMALFLMGFEGGYYMVRTVMLERAVEVAVRDVRLGGLVPTYDNLKANICDEAAIIPDCVNTLMVEMNPVVPDPGNVAQISSQPVRCIDSSSSDEQIGSFSIGNQNQAMLLRVCAISQPLFPTTGIGIGMRVDQAGNYALVARASFVNEPGSRAIDNTANSNANCSAGQGNGDEGCDPGNSGAHNNGGDDGSPNPGNGGNGGNGAGGNGNGNGGNS